MKETSPTEIPQERALLVGIECLMEKSLFSDTKELLLELEELVSNLDIVVQDKIIAKIQKPHANLFLGSGKAEEIIELAKELNCSMIIFDNKLSPVQQRNWEKLSGLTVIDRHEVILEIFAQRAQTKEAVLQVELAQMEYALPRLKRAWTHLSRQRGGGAAQRDVGEKQIELDKRMIRDRISQLKKDLRDVIQHRQTQRKKRMRIPFPSAAIVGYTNAGKSSLLNLLTQSKILAEDKLFATLDPTTRRLQLPSGQILLLTDTVGFIRNLPHGLVDAFKATLEEALVADFLMIVVDASNPSFEQHLKTTHKVLEELHAKDKPMLIVFNKIDLLEDDLSLKTIKATYPKACFMSVKTTEGVEQLLSMMEIQLEKQIRVMKLLIPHNRYDIIHELHQMGGIKKEEPLDEGVFVIGNIPEKLVSLVKEFEI
ncbi:MAG: GTPase HflX [Verrucomicrobia bacterium CG_4_10_14_3_um_filter_43_23]|nr:MAG: GTPase HflX [Verrucomicrobia bacterium CG1_02_43_26]PIP59051.1 MAG: GTPase HflX [Verrucomicrobia bacterium CG22_combo_CG10-13_8_21_14_all_43_17]PIX59148.1 MAG: GTPase HflX [Verrucomicrobia bacterium CG_4_10_14_3_um_filter_43_23]PIY61330.1 MAG: GTPase HflX [Verrucomicrobia bacterium CG_4_10_14_0_8_um_filter_43_34]PJA44111.1 MAG: GTPase HflX [Verrucomicrobia bacterium CG_4_9_14_3_um_filter_43_20]